MKKNLLLFIILLGLLIISKIVYTNYCESKSDGCKKEKMDYEKDGLPKEGIDY
jgi:hypothetical protein